MVLINVILPKIVQYLFFHCEKMFCNSRSFTSKFYEEMSSRLVLKIMPNTEKGPLVHSSFLSSHNLSVLPISEPIQMHCVFSKLGVTVQILIVIL